MAQHDYDIANATGAAVRADLNNMADAMVSNNSGATEPASMFAYMWWADTTTGLMKQRNGANNAWLTRGSLTSSVVPAFESTGINDNATSTAITIDANENVLVGKTSSSLTTVGLQLNASGASYTTRSAATPVYVNRTTSHGEMFSLRKDNEDVGTIGAAAGNRFYLGGGTTGFKFANNINAILPYNPDPSTLADRDAAIDLGHASVRWKDAYLSGGVYLGGTGAANKLDDYEEGTWTPAASGCTFTVSRAYYVKIGASLTLHFSVTVNTTTGTSASLLISGVPFVSSTANAESNGSFMGNNVDFDSNVVHATLYGYSRDGTLAIYETSDAATWGSLRVNQLSVGSSLIGSITLEVD